MKRKILKEMQSWKETENGRTALLIEGARRVGKTCSAVQFAEGAYRSHILIDFDVAPWSVKDLFENSLHDLDFFFQQLSLQYGTRLYERNSLIILDQVQRFPKARSSVKHLVADGRYDIMETGSLISLPANVRGILIPSEERMVPMYPMDLEEFFGAIGEGMLWDGIRDAYEHERPLAENLHRKAMELYRQYVLVGGMPQAVEEFRVTRDVERSEAVKREILHLYRADTHKYAQYSERKAEAVLDSVPSQLVIPRRHFSPSRVKPGARNRDLLSAIEWLDESMIINKCLLTRDPMPGHALDEDDSRFRCYMGDTGLLITLALSENAKMPPALLERLAPDKLEADESLIAKNAVAQMLTAAGHRLYYYTDSSRENASARMDVDFLLRSNPRATGSLLHPIEVKSGKSRRTRSPGKFAAKFSQACGVPCVVSRGNFGRARDCVWLPFYMVPLL